MEALAFRFLEPGRLVDDELMLNLVEKAPSRPGGIFVSTYVFEMRHVHTLGKIGTLSLRAESNEYIVKYLGHIGYRVEEAYRGRRYAARSCRLILPLARAHGLNPLWITCNPDNWPSRRTCELLGAEMVEIVALPKDSEMYQRGERQKCRYRLFL